MSNILITGATGFVGQNLKIYLRDSNYIIKELSLRNKNWNQQIDQSTEAYIHLAGKAHDTTNSSSEEEYFQVNRDLTIELFDLFLKSDAKDFFYFSSVKAAADSVDGILTEDFTSKPKTPYGKSKLEAEQYIFSKQLPEGKRIFIIRPSMIHGPGNKGNLNLLYGIVRRGIPWPLASFENKRSFLSIDNLCFLISSMLDDKSIKSGVYNFADDEAVSTNDLVRIISSVSNKSTRLWYIPRNFMISVAKIGDRIGLPLNSERLKKLTEDYVVSNAKIKKALNLEKLPVDSISGLKQTISSFKEN